MSPIDNPDFSASNLIDFKNLFIFVTAGNKFLYWLSDKLNAFLSETFLPSIIIVFLLPLRIA